MSDAQKAFKSKFELWDISTWKKTNWRIQYYEEQKRCLYRPRI